MQVADGIDIYNSQIRFNTCHCSTPSAIHTENGPTHASHFTASLAWEVYIPKPQNLSAVSSFQFSQSQCEEFP